jgi:GNAT superfamily N-acetyltransferase
MRRYAGVVAEYDVRSVPLDEVRIFRRALLHPRTDAVESTYPGDEDRDALHLAGFRDGRMAGVASIAPGSLLGEPGPDVWRVRGLVVDHGHRGYGLGGLLLSRLLDHAAAMGARIVWGIAPAAAYGFFSRFGLERNGEPLVGADGTPQYRIVARFSPAR